MEAGSRTATDDDDVPIDAELVRRLVSDQFPQWSGLPVRKVAHDGWDNRTFHLGSTMSVRLPSAAGYAPAVEKEHRWLPELARHLPLPIPTPLGKGNPGRRYPFSWSVHRWLAGESVRAGRIADPIRFARDLAEFLIALQAVNTSGGPPPGQHNWFRGGPLRSYDETARNALGALRGHVDVVLADEVWAVALDAGWDGARTWFHGDVTAGNLLLGDDGQLAAVIDFGTCGVGDPSCDLAVAWTLLEAEGRRAFRERLSVDDETWARGRGWALWKTLATCAQTLGRDDEEGVEARRVLARIFAEYEHRAAG